MTATAIQQEALSRARGGMSARNYAAIMAGFADKGIPADQVLPRVNVFTFAAWKALGRHVRRGEHGVRICTFRQTDRAPRRRPSESDTAYAKRSKGGSVPSTCSVFHISQTDETGGGS